METSRILLAQVMFLIGAICGLIGFFGLLSLLIGVGMFLFKLRYGGEYYPIEGFFL